VELPGSVGLLVQLVIIVLIIPEDDITAIALADLTKNSLRDTFIF